MKNFHPKIFPNKLFLKSMPTIILPNPFVFYFHFHRGSWFTFSPNSQKESFPTKQEGAPQQWPMTTLQQTATNCQIEFSSSSSLMTRRRSKNLMIIPNTGMVMMSAPITMRALENSLPTTLRGVMSPYPTVTRVCMVHHMDSGMLVNCVSSCIPSTKI